MTGAWKAVIGVVAGVAVVVAVVFWRGAGESETAAPSTEPESRPARAEARSSLRDRSPQASGRVLAGAAGGTAPVESGPDATQVPAAPPSPPLAKPTASEVAHRKALAEPGNPERWIEYAKALDAEGQSDLALAALKRALHLGVEFEGRRDVMRLVREYEEYLGKARKEAPADRRARSVTPKKPTHSRAK